MNRCSGLMGLIFGHKFEPRYDSPKTGSLPPETVLNNAVIAGHYVVEAVVSAYGSTELYVKDVCARCGAVADRQIAMLTLPPTSNTRRPMAGITTGKVACPGCFHVFEAVDSATELICPRCAAKFQRAM